MLLQRAYCLLYLTICVRALLSFKIFEIRQSKNWNVRFYFYIYLCAVYKVQCSAVYSGRESIRHPASSPSPSLTISLSDSLT